MLMDKIIIDGIEIVEGMKFWRGEYFVEILEVVPETMENWAEVTINRGHDGDYEEMEVLELGELDDMIELRVIVENYPRIEYPKVNHFEKFFSKIDVEVDTEVGRDWFNVDGEDDECYIYINLKDENGRFIDTPVLINDSMFCGHQIVLHGRRFVCINCGVGWAKSKGYDLSDIKILQSLKFDKETLENLIKSELKIEGDYTIV